MHTETEDRFWVWVDHIGAGCYWLGMGLMILHVLPQVLRAWIWGGN